jgi:hypothetical protein
MNDPTAWARAARRPRLTQHDPAPRLEPPQHQLKRGRHSDVVHRRETIGCEENAKRRYLDTAQACN